MAALSPLIFTQLIDKLARPIPHSHLGPSTISYPLPDPVWELIA